MVWLLKLLKQQLGSFHLTCWVLPTMVLLYICQIFTEELQAVHLITSSQIFRVKAVLDNTETYCTLIHNCKFAPVGKPS